MRRQDPTREDECDRHEEVKDVITKAIVSLISKSATSQLQLHQQ
jgi:hypothetical protein